MKFLKGEMSYQSMICEAALSVVVNHATNEAIRARDKLRVANKRLRQDIDSICSDCDGCGWPKSNTMIAIGRCPLISEAALSVVVNRAVNKAIRERDALRAEYRLLRKELSAAKDYWFYNIDHLDHERWNEGAEID